MKLVIAYIQPHKLQDVKKALYEAKVFKMSVTNALGCGEQQGYEESYRGIKFEVNLLKKVRQQATDAGFTSKFSAEFEFWVFEETPHSLYEKGFRDLKSLSPGMFGYSWLREGQYQTLVDDILDTCREYDIEDVDGRRPHWDEHLDAAIDDILARGAPSSDERFLLRMRMHQLDFDDSRAAQRARIASLLGSPR